MPAGYPLPGIPAAARGQLTATTGPCRDEAPRIRDLTSLPWCAIDNGDSFTLDQLATCEPLAAGAVKMFMAAADVSARVTNCSTQ